jgi:hypothetical protein
MMSRRSFLLTLVSAPLLMVLSKEIYTQSIAGSHSKLSATDMTKEFQENRSIPNLIINEWCENADQYQDARIIRLSSSWKADWL